ncbi:MAG: hypothetical protein R6V75_12220 [Bacteroidales bacterium]
MIRPNLPRTAALLFSALILISPAFGQKSNQVLQYPYKSAVIEYTYSGNTTGTSTHYIDDHGRKTAQFNQFKTKSFGSTTETNQQVILMDSVVYTIDLIKKEGVKTKIQNINEKEIQDWAEEIDSLWKSMGFKKTGKGEILGKQCDIWEGMSTKVWVWQNFAMKTETTIFGKMVMEATKLDLNASISADKFRIPDGIKMSEETLDMANPALDTLKNELKKGLEDFKSLFDTKKK